MAKRKQQPKGVASGIPVWCAFDKIVSLGELNPRPDNPNTHPQQQIDLLADLIKAHGWRAPITVSMRSNLITRGHGRLRAAEQIGVVEAPVDYQDYASDEAEMADVIADNRIAELSLLDEDLVKPMLLEFDDDSDWLNLAGYTGDELELLLEVEDPGGSGDDDPGPQNPATTDIKLGDVIELGNHRLLCGSANSETCVDFIMGEATRLLLTDPPYCGDGLNGARSQHVASGKVRRIANNKLTPAELTELLVESFESINFAPGASAYLWTSWKTEVPYFNAYSRLGWTHHDTLVAVKNGLGLDGKSFFRRQHEYVHFCLPQQDSDPVWNGGQSTSDVIEFVRPTGDDRPEGVATPKPVATLEKLIKLSTNADDVVLDPFAGGGSTMIACQRTGRRCVSIELEPLNCQAIVDRWNKLGASQ